jgi:hypothetical protein
MRLDTFAPVAFTIATVLFYVAPLKLQATVPSVPPVFIQQTPSLDKYTDAEIEILEKLNRVDLAHLKRLRQIVIPADLSLDALHYSPLPQELSCLAGWEKFIAVHLPTQVFGAYERGALVRWGAISSGRQKHATPSGIFHLTWRSRARTSTENPDWHMEWYFNFHNRRGLAFHQYELPGRPASHACIRLSKGDATWLYHWGESWTLTPDGKDVLQPGTPVYIMGEYAYQRPRPWLEEASSNALLEIALPEKVCNAAPKSGSPPLLLTENAGSELRDAGADIE